MLYLSTWLDALLSGLVALNLNPLQHLVQTFGAKASVVAPRVWNALRVLTGAGSPCGRHGSGAAKEMNQTEEPPL